MATFEEKENIDYAVEKFKSLVDDLKIDDHSQLQSLDTDYKILNYRVDKIKDSMKDLLKRIRGLEKRVKLLEEDSSFSE